MKITHCLHTAILVSDLQKADDFYGQILGLEKVDRILKYPGVWYQVGDYQIHLIVHPNLITSLPNTEQWGRNNHIALAVDDLNQAIENLQNHGHLVQHSRSGRQAIFVKDPDGNIIEITQVINP
ncbi:Glyoxalase/bleomycin resistance protein/dioxygenase [Rippkaea orientalis PCC 8801]|uniref:Glyoxalase/bleomycin resistance protein/dioxygenase n=1 Tax=Rippkaea orientalis (strain PCC 8801 / RF-1) TaxID=41431 RepID=B7K206_RIPO1|nr:VOC family protein [Rippkaea orientalis]ACK64313.1 Glyoxalase/bleomycin resistance protein/dioxygenase [Rippkaea orientalis PCC 8801]